MLKEILILVAVVIIIALLFKLFKRIFFFVINSVVGILAFFGYNTIFSSDIVVNAFSILIVGVGGTIGFVIVLVLHFLGIAF